jgi:tight adherence protein C
MAILISAMVFTGTLLVLLAGYYFLRFHRERQGVFEKVRSGGIVARPELAAAGAVQGGNPLKGLLFGLSARTGHRFRRGENEAGMGRFRQLLLTAGVRHQGAPVVFWGAKIICAAAFPVLAFIGYLVAERSLLDVNILLVVGIAGFLGFFFPDLCLHLWIRRRKEQIVQGFPDALDLLVVCVEAGMGIDAAINRVAEEIRLSNRVISDEFRLLNLELRAGKSRAEALRNLGTRTDVEEVRSFATLLVQTDRFGTSVAQALRVHSDAMRVRRYQRAEEMAAKLPVKLLFPLILFIFPAVLVVIVGPAAIQIYQQIIAR